MTATPGCASATLPARAYNLDATLNSGQAFRWQPSGDGWEGVVSGRWVRLRQEEARIIAETPGIENDWRWLQDYLQLDVDLDEVVRQFPDDGPMRAAVAACRGLRLLRQEPWECLASFILSSTKQIVQIRQIVCSLSERFGEPVAVPRGWPPAFSFPTPLRLANASEDELRACKMGFRAPYLRETAQAIAAGFDLIKLFRLPAAHARQELLQFPGVGPKIANCVLLFAYGFQTAFPVDVWVMRGLKALYFPDRRISSRRLDRFTAEHFGPFAGYAQQYLFHYMRTRTPTADLPTKKPKAVRAVARPATLAALR